MPIASYYIFLYNKGTSRVGICALSAAWTGSCQADEKAILRYKFRIPLLQRRGSPSCCSIFCWHFGRMAQRKEENAMNKSKSPLFTTHSIALMGLLLAAEIVLSPVLLYCNLEYQDRLYFYPSGLVRRPLWADRRWGIGRAGGLFGRYLIPHWALLPWLYLYPVLRRRCVWPAAAKKAEHGAYRRRSFAHTDIGQSAVGFVLDLYALR